VAADFLASVRPVSTRISLLVALLLVAGLAAAGCGGDDPPASSTASTPGPVSATGDLTVFAAASLTGAFDEVGKAFTAANPGAKVTFSYDASSALVQQITQGAPADLFASADTANMARLTGAGLAAETPVVFATNVLSIIVAKGNPRAIHGPGDLARSGLKVVLCADPVPCGAYARQVLDRAHVAVSPVSLEQNVKGVVTKVSAGEADAGIVYATDVAAAGSSAEGVPIPSDVNVEAAYPIAPVAGSKHVGTARAFVDFLRGTEGQAILRRYGFGMP
jgi:molybdate transport system substrate-binding protein